MRRAVALLVALAALALPASAGALVLGIADQKPDMFSDARFASLGIRYARMTVGWDALTDDAETRSIDRWLFFARLAHVEPLISFEHSNLDGRRRVLPRPERLRYEFRRFRARYPWVTTFAAWNEANHCGEPTCHRATLVAAYYNAMRSECPECRIIAGEVLDMPNMVSWVKQFLSKARGTVRYWGLHNYLDTNRERTIGTRRLLEATHGSQIWFTETGGIVHRRNRSKITFPESPEHAAEATRWLFHRLVPLSRKITRVYLYHWNAGGDDATWDSALIDGQGIPRPALAVLTAEARRLAQRRRSRSPR